MELNYSGAIVCARDAHLMISVSTRSSIAAAPGVVSGGFIGDEGDGGGEVVGDGLGTVLNLTRGSSRQFTQNPSDLRRNCV